MKVIFLDHDGVICLVDEWGSRNKKRQTWTAETGITRYEETPFKFRVDNFNQKAIRVLNSILEETGAEIVVSSDWRCHGTLTEMGEYYLEQGIAKRPIDFTPTALSRNLRFWDPRTDLEETRSYEILEWLKAHPEVTNWVAVDDLDMHARINPETGITRWGLSNFVWTPLSTEGIKQSGIKDKILKFLQ